VAAWLLDETGLAVRLLREALSQLRAPGVRGSSAAALSGAAVGVRRQWPVG
jgi:hypothetical protein